MIDGYCTVIAGDISIYLAEYLIDDERPAISMLPIMDMTDSRTAMTNDFIKSQRRLFLDNYDPAI